MVLPLLLAAAAGLVVGGMLSVVLDCSGWRCSVAMVVPMDSRDTEMVSVENEVKIEKRRNGGLVAVDGGNWV